ncbi:MAG TPA: hypothetical protein VNX21_02465, partial [Candidatus Thermoplasmatota archaeon]|nr:hypothetical protein [Candidatus Thermoplasmatota archaeon]
GRATQACVAGAQDVAAVARALAGVEPGFAASGASFVAVHPLLAVPGEAGVRVVVGGPRPLDAPAPVVMELAFDAEAGRWACPVNPR